MASVRVFRRRSTGAHAQSLVERSESVADLSWVFNLPETEAGVFGEGDLYGEVGGALVAKIRHSEEPKARAAALMWLIRLSVFYPDAIVRPSEFPDLVDRTKVRVRGVRDRHADLYRELIASSDQALQVGAIHALCQSEAATERDVLALRAVARSSRKADVCGSALLGCGVVGKRLRIDGRSLGELADLARSSCGNKSQLVRACGLCALALLHPDFTEADQRVLQEILDAKSPLPRGWGWTAGGMKYTVGDLAMRVCEVALLPDRSPLIEALGRSHASSEPNAFARRLLRVAFRPGELTPSGVAVREIDSSQRRALELIASCSSVRREMLFPIGVWRIDDLKSLLDEAPPSWQPITVRVGEVERPWHLTKVWYAVAHGEIDSGTAIDAIAGAFSPNEIVAACSSGFLHAWLSFTGASPAVWRAVHQASCELFRRLHGGRPERAEEILRAVLARPSFDNGTVALWSLSALEDMSRDLRGEELEAVGVALLNASSVEPLYALASRLPLAAIEGLLVKRLRDSAYYVPWPWPALRFVGLAPTPVVMTAVLDALFDNPNRTSDAREFFEGADEGLRAGLLAAGDTVYRKGIARWVLGIEAH
jgi:hypothetical protein